MKSRILVVEDQEEKRDELFADLSTPDCQIVMPKSQDEAIDLIKQGGFDCVVIDVQLEEENYGGTRTSGLEILTVVRKKNSLVPALVISVSPQIVDFKKIDPEWPDDAESFEVPVSVAAIMLGAFDFIERGAVGIRFHDFLPKRVKLALKYREAMLERRRILGETRIKPS